MNIIRGKSDQLERIVVHVHQTLPPRKRALLRSFLFSHYLLHPLLEGAVVTPPLALGRKVLLSANGLVPLGQTAEPSLGKSHFRELAAVPYLLLVVH